MILALVLAGLLVLSLLANLQSLVSALTSAGTRGGPGAATLQESTLEYNRSRHKIAVIDVVGLIFSDGLDRRGLGPVSQIRDQLARAAADDHVKAVVLRIDSPGGEAMAADEMNRLILKFQSDCGKPVVASMGSVAASGGYYVAAPCRWIVANEMTITGSIGVILHGYNYRGLLDKVGVRPDVYKSGRFKDMLSGDKAEREITAEERSMVQNLIDQTFKRFLAAVREGRTRAAKLNGSDGRSLDAQWESYADGRILTGQQAWDWGFVDEIGTLETAVRRAQALADIPDANLIRYQRPFDIGNLFRLFGEAESRTLRIDLGVDLPQLHPGRLYFVLPLAVR
jgi:protease-4